MIREDWEKAGPYENHFSCPGATMMTRIMGKPMKSMAWNRYEDEQGESIKTAHRFTTTSYEIAKRRYEAGEEILFETLKIT